MKTKGEVHLAMKELLKKVGMSDPIICDPARGQIIGDSRKLASETVIAIYVIELNISRKNHADQYIHIQVYLCKV